MRLQRTDFSSQSTISRWQLTGCRRVAIPGCADRAFISNWLRTSPIRWGNWTP